MAYRKIEEIVVNGNSGEIFDSYIYGCNLELGFSESPTKLTLNIVKKDSSDFTSFPNSLLTSYFIRIGSLTLSKMYLYSYEISRTVGQKVATLNFLDGSFILDKIFVGLINRHKGTYTGGKQKFEVDVQCVTCDGSDIVKRKGNINRKIVTSKIEVQVDPLLGGSIILGQEQFVELDCDIPDVAYNFTDLLQGMTQASIKYSNLVDLNPKYQQPYVGTLREVLSNWCADFGYTFYWDYQSNSIKGIDLKLAVDYIDKIKAEISANTRLGVNNTGKSTLAIESYNESESLEGTVDQKFVSRYLKPFRTKTSNSSLILDRSFSNIKPERFDVTEFDITRAILGKYNQNLRTIYCCQAIESDGKYLGFTALGNKEVISKNQKNDNFFTKIFDYGYNNNAITQFIDKNNGAQIFVALYSPAQEEKYIAWENAIADMIGKYYQGDSKPIDPIQSCEETFFFEKTVSVTPSSEKYSEKNKYDLPFSEVIIGPESNEGAKWNIPTLYIFSRETTYGTTQEDYDSKMLDEDGSDPFSAFIPQFLPIEGLAYSRLSAAKIEAERNNDSETATKLQQIISAVDNLKGTDSNGEKKVVFVFLPPAALLNDALAVSWKTKINELEIAKEEDDDEEKEECVTKCDKSVVDEACGECPEQQQPFVGLTNSSARSLTVSSSTIGKSIDLILPSEANYSGYETINNSLKFTVPGQKLVFGDIGTPNADVLSLQVAEADITNDLDPLDGSSGVINMYVPDGQGKFNLLSPAAYHTDLSRKIVNSITSPRKNLSLSIIGLNFGGLEFYLNPDKGLTSLSINLSENGATSQISFANRPKVLPKREAISQKIAPTIKLNTYRPK